MNKRAFKRSLLAAVSRLIGTILGAGAGSLMHNMLGDGIAGWTTAVSMASIGFILILLTEYERER